MCRAGSGQYTIENRIIESQLYCKRKKTSSKILKMQLNMYDCKGLTFFEKERKKEKPAGFTLEIIHTM